ncbi:MAG TPA: PadR family transcriptional regulator [Acidimicrobiales bacterium]
MGEAANHPKLPATAYAVLGLLSFGRELSGYDLKKWADSSLRFFYWSPAVSQIYGELKRLDELGYVTSRDVPQDDLRNKRVYRISDTGREALRRWVEQEEVEPPVLKHSPLLRVWLGHLTEPARIRDLLHAHRANTEQLMEDARKAEAVARNNPDWYYPELVTRFAMRHFEAELQLVDALLAELDTAEVRAPRS